MSKLTPGKKIINDILAGFGIKINGTRPWDVKINSDDAYDRPLKDGDIGVGESYMEGEWDCKRIDELVFKAAKINFEEIVLDRISKIKLLWQFIKAKAWPASPFEIGKRHYDLGNELFKHMLDKRMVYSCGYWKKAQNLDQAQEAKLELVCQKLGLKKGMKVLDIGGGWGSFAKYAAEKYKVHVVNITVSKRQAELAKILCRGLPVETRFNDYRQIKGKFDRVVSVGMFEHVNSVNYRTYMETVNRLLKDNGLFLLHTIGVNNSTGDSGKNWITKYIFPNSEIPALLQITEAIKDLFIMEDWHNFGLDYDKTLMVWFDNFNKNWDKIKNEYDERFFRMWKFYLLACAGMFRARKLQLWQIVLSKHGVPGGYESIR